MLGQGTFSQRIKVNTPNIKAKFKRPSDFIVHENVIDPGGSTGWHSHPGPALVIVNEGTFTLYDGDDRKCRPHRYGPGQSFVDQGGGRAGGSWPPWPRRATFPGSVRWWRGTRPVVTR